MQPRTRLILNVAAALLASERIHEGRITRQKEERDEITTINNEGWDFAKNGGKLKANPYPGGSAEWWAWHAGYTRCKKAEADLQRFEKLQERATA